MGFTTSCFIRKNTSELREKLQDMGYRQNIYDKNEYPWLAVNHNMFISVSEGFERLPEFNIDCGTNEELFIAIASMTDDEYGLYDYYIVTKDCIPSSTKGSIHRALPLSSVIPPSYYRKATVEELIEHFKED